MSAAVTWYHDSPVGPLRLEADGDHLTVLYFENEPVPPSSDNRSIASAE